VKKRPQKMLKAAPSVRGIMTCQKGHRWDVIDLNPERRTVKCPVCGANTSILQGLERT
jgi:hypothetical protein